jgi:hypothetical protein
VPGAASASASHGEAGVWRSSVGAPGSRRGSVSREVLERSHPAQSASCGRFQEEEARRRDVGVWALLGLGVLIWGHGFASRSSDPARG